MSDPNFYRKYECNIECYKMKASKVFRCAKCKADDITTGLLNAGEFHLSSGVHVYSGSFPLSTTHTITPSMLPSLSNRECSGTIDIYLDNDLYVNVTMGTIVKAAGTILQTLVYQRVGNFASTNMSFSGNNVTITCSPAANCRWVFRGI